VEPDILLAKLRPGQVRGVGGVCHGCLPRSFWV
jgi:hypothetical protein